MQAARDTQGRPSRLHAVRYAALGVAGVASSWCLWATARILAEGAPFALAARPTQAALELAAAAAIIVVGLFACARRSFSGIAGTGLGLAWLIREWANPATAHAWMLTAGLLFGAVWLPIAARLVLAHGVSTALPRASRAMILFVAVAAVGPAAFRTATLAPASAGCPSCAPNLLLIADGPPLALIADRVGGILQLTACVLLVGWLAISMISASAAVRLVRGPMVAAGAALLIAAGLGYSSALIEGFGSHEGMRRTIGGQSLSVLAIAAAIAWAPLRLLLMRRRTARLVTEIMRTPRPGSLRDELSRLVGDATIALGFPLDDGRVVDEKGREMTAPSMNGEAGAGSDPGRRSSTLLQRDGRALAVLFHRPGLLDDGRYRDTLARASGLAIGNERLHAELAAQVEDLRRSRAALVGSFDAERRRLERGLHDGAQQRAVSLLLALRLAASARADEPTAQAIAEVESALDELRELAHGLYPASLSEEGLGSALQELAERATIPLRILAAPNGRLPEAVETTGYAVIAATVGRADVVAAEVAAECSSSDLMICVRGQLSHPMHEPDAPAGGVALEDRVGAIGGTLTSYAAGGTLEVRAVLPCAS